MARQNTTSIRSFRPVSLLNDSVDRANTLEQARNLILRPQGGWCGPPIYDNLWELGRASTVETVYRNLMFNGTAVGDTAPRRATNKTIAIKINRQGKHFLLFYDLTSSKARGGPFYLGDDGTYTAGSYQFTTGPATLSVIEVGLDASARWYGFQTQGAWFLGNGVDPNAIVQLARAERTPGIWRKAASNVVPAAPVVAIKTPAAAVNTVQATVAFTRGGQPISFTANDQNYPGELGNAVIRIVIKARQNLSAVSSTLTGAGNVGDPYLYTLNAPFTITGSSVSGATNESLATFVNADSNAVTLFTATGANSGVDGVDHGPTAMANGTGSGGSDGFTNQTVTFFARYWDPGVADHGYEGPSSPISNTVILSKVDNKDLVVTVPVNAAAEGGRFTHLRLFMQVGEDAEAKWILVDPENPLPNGGSGSLARMTASIVVLGGSLNWSFLDVVRLSTTGTLPSGLSPGVDYYLREARKGTGIVRRNGATNALSLAGTFDAGEQITLTTTGTLPGGLSVGPNYFLKAPAVPGPASQSAAFNRVLVGSVNYLTVAGSGWNDGDEVVLTTTGTLPTGLAINTFYYLRPGTGDGDGYWYLSATPSGGGILTPNNGTGLHTMTRCTRMEVSNTLGGASIVLTSDGTGVHTAESPVISGQWMLSTTPDGAVATMSDAGTGVHTATVMSKSVVIGTETPMGEEMHVDQNRPLPHLHTAFASEQIWRAGRPDRPERVYASKKARVDEIAPEGVSLAPTDYVVVTMPTSSAGSSTRVSALIATESRLELHTPGGVALISPGDTSQRVFPQASAGALNASAICTYEGKDMYVLGADLQLRSARALRPGDFATTTVTSEFAALGSLYYLRDRVDLDEVVRNPGRVWVFPDTTSQHLWISLPGLDGQLRGFAYDLVNKGMVGEFDYPRVHGSCTMEPGMREIIFADEGGRLFVWDTSGQMDRYSNAFPTQAAFVPFSTETPMPAEYDGWGYVDYDHDGDGTPSRFYKATETVLETAMMDFGDPARRKAFQGVVWRTIANSRALVEVTFITLAGDSETFRYGDVNDSVNCRASMAIPDTAARVRMRIIGAEGMRWAMRDLSVLWTPQGRV